MIPLAKISLKKAPLKSSSTVNINGSKSESNRALILKSLEGGNSSIQNLSDARDTRTLQELLSSPENELNVLDAGTTMRFLTAFFAITNKHKVLRGTERMNQRPIGILVDALRQIGARIKYIDKEGFPPIEILGFDDQLSYKIAVKGDISSQYISALLMVAPILPHGLQIELLGHIGSRPYIQMTLDLMAQFGLVTTWTGNFILVPAQELQQTEIIIEPDWSGASYWYAFMALTPNECHLFLPGLKEQSLQGDSAISTIGNSMGVSTEFTSEGVILRKINPLHQVEIDFSDYPDLAQTVAVICAAKNIAGNFKGLKSLKIKETDRIAALQNELQKIGADLIQKGEDEYHLIPSKKIPSFVSVETYEDHRMAMAFAPLSMIMDVEIQEPEVVDKSYPTFWDQVEKARNI